MTYNITALENNTNLLELFTTMNTASGELLVIGILLTVFLVSFISFKSYETLTALRSSGFIVSILAVLFWSIDLISLTYMLIPTIATGLTIFLGFLQKE